jgi:hypothetical protein
MSRSKALRLGMNRSTCGGEGGKSIGWSAQWQPRRGSHERVNPTISRNLLCGGSVSCADGATSELAILWAMLVGNKHVGVETREGKRDGGTRTARMALPGVTARFSSLRRSMALSILSAQH